MFGDLIDTKSAFPLVQRYWFLDHNSRTWCMATTGTVLIAYVGVSTPVPPGAQTLSPPDCDAHKVLDGLLRSNRSAASVTTLGALSGWLGAYEALRVVKCTECHGGKHICEGCHGSKGHLCTCATCGNDHVDLCKTCGGAGVIGSCGACGGLGETAIESVRPVSILGLIIDANLLACALAAVVQDLKHKPDQEYSLAKGADGTAYDHNLFLTCDGLMVVTSTLTGSRPADVPEWAPSRINWMSGMSKLDLD